jgi:hypothetical protein
MNLERGETGFMKKLKKGDAVKVLGEGVIRVILDIQYEFDRYQLDGVSGWQYGIDNLSKPVKRFVITEVTNICDCCGCDTDEYSNNYAVTTNYEFSGHESGLVLCGYCLDMLGREIQRRRKSQTKGDDDK